MRYAIEKALAAATVCVLAGYAAGQSTFDQGTIDRQRNRLDHSTLAPNTKGWLNDTPVPHFWAWKLDTAVTDPDTPLYSKMQVWIHHTLKMDSLSSGALNTTSLNDQARDIADEIVSRHNATGGGEYAICLLRMHWIDLLTHDSDDLDDTIDLYNPATSSCDQWSTFIGSTETPSRASPWRANGVALADSVIEYLTDEIVDRVVNHVDFTGSSFPPPIRVFFDEEHGRQHGANSLDNLGEIESMLTDTSRWSSEALYGNYALWDSTPSVSLASEVFTSAPLANISGWNNACTPFVPNTKVYRYGSQHTHHQNPSFDHEFFPIAKTYSGILNTSIDGAIHAAFDHPLNDTDWGGFKWSNYDTSGYYAPTYPRNTLHSSGTFKPDDMVDDRFGWVQTEFLGSASIQSPVLYPADAWHEHDYGSTTETDFVESTGEAWIRTARTKLDHAIFSFNALDALSIDAPRHIAPWLTRVGTNVNRPGATGNYDDYDITTKDNVRDLIALCKAKGINEILFWGNPDSSANGKKCDDSSADAQYNWEATNDALSQVYDYTLKDITVNGTPTNYRPMLFSEEHTEDIAPTFAFGTGWTASFEAEFWTGTLDTLGDEYTFICEAMDGDGPWEDATYTLEIYNYDTDSYETITTTPTERFSSSTRRAVFTDLDSDNYSNEWEHTFDDQDQLDDVDDSVYDRKKISVWDHLPLPIGSAALEDYHDSARMKFRLTASHNTLLNIGDTADPFRVDLVQLYETECENDNIINVTPETPCLADLNDDGVVDTADLGIFYANYGPCDCTGDLNGDTNVDSADLGIFIAAWGSTCTGCPEDINNDGVVDTADFGLLIANFGATCVGDLNGDCTVDTADMGILISEYGPCP